MGKKQTKAPILGPNSMSTMGDRSLLLDWMVQLKTNDHLEDSEIIKLAVKTYGCTTETASRWWRDAQTRMPEEEEE